MPCQKANTHRSQGWGPLHRLQSKHVAEDAETLDMGIWPVPWCPGSAEARATTKDTDKCIGELRKDGGRGREWSGGGGRARGEGGHLVTASCVDGQGPAHNNLGLRANHCSVTATRCLFMKGVGERRTPGYHRPDSLAELVNSRFRERPYMRKKK